MAQPTPEELAKMSLEELEALAPQEMSAGMQRAAAHQKDTYLSAQYRRIAYRRGPKKAAMAVAHSILVIAYRLIERQEDYHDLGGNYFDKRRPEATVKRLTERLEQLGYQVSINAQTAVASA